CSTCARRSRNSAPFFHAWTASSLSHDPKLTKRSRARTSRASTSVRAPGIPLAHRANPVHASMNASSLPVRVFQVPVVYISPIARLLSARLGDDAAVGLGCLPVAEEFFRFAV